MKRFIVIAVGAAMFVLTAACSGAGAPVSAPVSASATPSVPVRLPVPQACLDALNEAEASLMHARTGLGYTAEMADAASAGFLAAAEFDVSGLKSATSRIEGVNVKLGVLTPLVGAAVQSYNASAAKCRAGVAP